MGYRFAVRKQRDAFLLIDANRKVLFKQIGGRMEDRYRQILLHELDLQFCLRCLTGLREIDHNKESDLAEAYWISSVTRFFKCFAQSKARFSLSAAKVFKGNAKSTDDFQYFRTLRNKHVAHDENMFSDALVAVAISASTPVFMDVVGSPIHLYTIDTDRARMEALAYMALEWVRSQRTEIEAKLKVKYSNWSIEKLLSLPDLVLQPPTEAQVASTRT